MKVRALGNTLSCCLNFSVGHDSLMLCRFHIWPFQPHAHGVLVQLVLPCDQHMLHHATSSLFFSGQNALDPLITKVFIMLSLTTVFTHYCYIQADVSNIKLNLVQSR